MWDLPWDVGNTMLHRGTEYKTYHCPGTAPKFTEADWLAPWSQIPEDSEAAHRKRPHRELPCRQLW
jgi:hypothetical protein